jgi:hypothetical protein
VHWNLHESLNAERQISAMIEKYPYETGLRSDLVI